MDPTLLQGAGPEVEQQPDLPAGETQVGEYLGLEQRYKLLGNGLNLRVAEWVVARLLED